MADKPTVTHFAPDHEDTGTVNNGLPDKSELSSLYAKPKTYVQKKEDDLVRQVRLRRLRPKYPYFNIALYGSVVFAFIIWFGQNLGRWWIGNGTDIAATMGNVFLAFGLGVVGLALFVRWILYTHEQLTHFNGLPRLFWAIYAGAVLGMVALWLSGVGGGYENIVWVPLLGVIHFAVTLITARFNATYDN